MFKKYTARCTYVVHTANACSNAGWGCIKKGRPAFLPLRPVDDAPLRRRTRRCARVRPRIQCSCRLHVALFSWTTYISTCIVVIDIALHCAGLHCQLHLAVHPCLCSQCLSARSVIPADEPHSSTVRRKVGEVPFSHLSKFPVSTFWITVPPREKKRCTHVRFWVKKNFLLFRYTTNKLGSDYMRWQGQLIED